ncbi:glucose-1-phosphate thymidylyltransferase [Actinomadura montaniterrae]|uniref:Glucose-1-phosphate thymidylyltransferase n=1 Tax=Actinomadura montaniterrae TaxID=1803903 RepID=A0A6L3VZJ3_9ACTN|nr:glucose-1-phosphate thymidylyltransferase [Actinomadura montaniterrae]KAB2381579.1 glucose-1-phosphate thymidylyltransferase [Actinomadura montaniterrae]
MRALVLSGGTGSRLRPFTHSLPKQLIPVANTPVLVHVLRNLRRLGIDEIGIIVGDTRAEIEAALGDGAEHGVRITYIPQEAPLGLAHCVTIAEDFLGDEDFVMYLGDNVLPDGIEAAADRFREERPDALILVTKVPDPQAFGVAELADGDRVSALVEKPERPRSDLAVMGVYFFTSKIHAATRAIVPSARGELEITDAIQHLVERGGAVVGHRYDGYWKDTGTIDDLLECNRVMLDRLEAGVRGEVDESSVLTGTVVIEPGAVVTGSRVAGPAVIGRGSRISGCRIGPYTAVGPDCELADSSLGDSIILEGASVQGVQGLRGSLVGRWARVRAEAEETYIDRFGGTDRRLLVGDHSRVEGSA